MMTKPDATKNGAGDKPKAADLVTLATGLVGAAVAQEVLVMQAEFAGLAKGAIKPATPAEAAQIEAETEAGFDNMPV